MRQVASVAVTILVLAGCVVVTDPAESILRPADPCAFGVCLPSADPTCGWEPVARVAGDALGRSIYDLWVHDGRVVWHTPPADGVLGVRAYDVGRQAVYARNVTAPDGIDSPGILGEVGGHVLIGETPLGREGPALLAVDPVRGHTAVLHQDEVRLLDAQAGQALVSWRDGDGEVVTIWNPATGASKEVKRRDASDPPLVGALDGEGVLLVEHVRQEGTDLLARSVQRVGPTSWDVMLEDGWGITAIAPTRAGFVTLAITHAYHTHHHSHGHSQREVTFFGTDARPDDAIIDDGPAVLARSIPTGIVAGWGGRHAILGEGVGEPFFAMGYDAARHEAYWLHDDHLWRAPAGTPLPDGWRG